MKDNCRIRILVVDDEAPLLDIVNQVLSKNGYQVITADSGEEALDIYKKEVKNIDLVMLDIGMPGMGGHRCLKKILEINPDAAVIIASGYIDNEQLNESLAVGVSGFAAKPYKRPELLKIIRQVLARHKNNY